MGLKQFIEWYKGNNQTSVDSNVQHPTNNLFALSIPGTRFDYAAEVGTGLGSNVIMSPVQWVMRTFPEAPVKLEKQMTKGEPERVIVHPFLDLIENPNPFYTYETLIMASMLSWTIAGNSYWLKARNALGQVIQLWYMPHWMIRPVGDINDPSVFISHYEYNPNGTIFKIPTEDIVHFRFGLDPRNVRLGLSPLAAVLREVFTDDQASNYSASILRNMGIPGVIMSPKDGEGIGVDDALAVKEKFGENFGGDNKGQLMVMTTGMSVDTFAFDTKQMALPDIRDISEERVCAAVGIPPAVVGFGAGLQTTKVGATMNAMINLAWTGNIIPSQRVIGQTMEKQLLPDFDNNKALQVGYDNTKVAALQEDKNAKVKRLSDGVMKGWAKVSDAREAEGLSVEESDRVYLRNPLLVPFDD